MSSALVLGLTDPQGGKVKRSDYALKDNDYVIREGDTAGSIASVMKVNEQTIADLGNYQTGDVIPSMPSEMPETTLEDAHRVDPKTVTTDPALLEFFQKQGIDDPSQLSSDDYMIGMFAALNDQLIQDEANMGEMYDEAESIKNLVAKNPKQIKGLFSEFSRIQKAEREAREYEESKDPSAVGGMFNMTHDIVDEQPPIGGFAKDYQKAMLQ